MEADFYPLSKVTITWTVFLHKARSVQIYKSDLFAHHTCLHPSCHHSRPLCCRLGPCADTRDHSCNGKALWEGREASLEMKRTTIDVPFNTAFALVRKWHFPSRRIVVVYKTCINCLQRKGLWATLSTHHTCLSPRQSCLRNRPCRHTPTCGVCIRCCCKWTHQPGRRKHLKWHKLAFQHSVNSGLWNNRPEKRCMTEAKRLVI